MELKKNRRVLESAGVLIIGAVAPILFPNSENAWFVLMGCLILVLLRHTFLKGLREGLSPVQASPGTHAASPGDRQASVRTMTRPEIIGRHFNLIREGATDLESKVRGCLREIAASEGWSDQAPAEWEALWRWRRRGAPDSAISLASALEEQFRGRERELARQKLERDTERLWRNHAAIVTRFLEIAERKVSVLDDYGDERWDLLPKEIETCLRKISLAEGRPLTNEQLKGFRKSSWGFPNVYASLAARLKGAFIEHHLARDPARHDGLDDLSGIEFETYVARILKGLGYEVTGTPPTCDQGADLVAKKEERIIAVQAKRYKTAVGNKAVQEVVAAVKFYGASEGWVVTNANFTPAARALAQKNGIRLIDGEELGRLQKSEDEDQA